MTEFLGNMYSWFTFIPKITLSNLFEILILTVLIYEVLLWVKSTRAGVLLRGGMIIVGFYLLAAALHLNTITWIINHMGQLVLTALIIIFQPELRKALEQLGSKNIITDLFISENSRQQEGYTEKTVNEITRAAFEMGKVKTGVLDTSVVFCYLSLVVDINSLFLDVILYISIGFQIMSILGYIINFVRQERV